MIILKTIVAIAALLVAGCFGALIGILEWEEWDAMDDEAQIGEEKNDLR